MRFRQMLAERQSKVNSLVCVGLDPLEEKLPPCLITDDGIPLDAVENWMVDIAVATSPFASMFKPNLGHWEAFHGGLEALGRAISRIRNLCPDIPIFADCKRGDISRTQVQYRKAVFDILGADGMNFSPYMGKDCMAALVDKNNPGKALVGLCYTSNPDARQMQDVFVDTGAGKYWEFVAGCVHTWAEELGVLQDAGLVMAAAYVPKGYDEVYSEHLYRCRRIVGNDMWFLIPGVGAQGGCIVETVRAAYAGPGSIVINSSSEIDFASSGEDYAQAAAYKAKALRDAINAVKGGKTDYGSSC